MCAGTKDVTSVNPDMTLANLGLDSLMGVEVKQTLERDHGIVLPMKGIRQLTINKLKTIACGDVNIKSGNSDKLDSSTTLQRYDYENMMPVESIVRINSGLEEANEKKRVLFVVHPIEGSTICLTSLMSQVKRPVYGVQCTSQAPLLSIYDLAKFYLQQLRSIQSEGPYTIAGYSFGACVAFEMALQLEATGNVST